jgi:hypothetical protein
MKNKLLIITIVLSTVSAIKAVSIAKKSMNNASHTLKDSSVYSDYKSKMSSLLSAPGAYDNAAADAARKAFYSSSAFKDFVKAAKKWYPIEISECRARVTNIHNHISNAVNDSSLATQINAVADGISVFYQQKGVFSSSNLSKFKSDLNNLKMGIKGAISKYDSSELDGQMKILYKSLASKDVHIFLQLNRLMNVCSNYMALMYSVLTAISTDSSLVGADMSKVMVYLKQ